MVSQKKWWIPLVGLVLAACSGGVPNVTPQVPPRPDLSPVNRQNVKPLPRKGQDSHASNSSSSSACQNNTSCSGWTETVNNNNPDAGTYEMDWACASGGEVASDDTVGTYASDGSGAYTETISMRDGSSVVWQGTQSVLSDGSFEDDASDNLGDSRKTNSVYNPDGSSTLKETWVYVSDGTYVITGTQSATGAFNGQETYSSPAQPNYTWVAQVSTATDGTSTYNVQDAWPGFTDSYVAVYKPDGSFTYNFKTDDLSTTVSPDYTGAYSYLADGSGTGGYVQNFDDGSLLNVSDVINADCTYVESWKYNGPPPSNTLEQTGTINYAADGSGSGSETNYLANGTTQTCAITVASNGSYTLGACQ